MNTNQAHYARCAKSVNKVWAINQKIKKLESTRNKLIEKHDKAMFDSMYSKVETLNNMQQETVESAQKKEVRSLVFQPIRMFSK